MGASFTPDSILPIIATSEDEDASASIGVSENTGGSITSIRVPSVPDWMTVTVSGGVDIQTRFTDSPFPYRVHSIDDDRVVHSVDSIHDVPCDHYTFKYERLSHGTLFYNFTVTCEGFEREGIGSLLTPFTASKTFVIEIYANYSIGKNLIQELIQCQR